MEQANVKQSSLEQCREAYRYLVRHAAFDELKLLHQMGVKRWQRLFRRRHSAEILAQGKHSARDRSLAQQYCDLVGATFESTFMADLAFEVSRFKRAAERARLSVVNQGRLAWLRAISLRSWLLGSLPFLPLTFFALWTMARLFKVSGSLEWTEVSLAICLGLVLLALPTILLVEQHRREKIEQWAAV